MVRFLVLFCGLIFFSMQGAQAASQRYVLAGAKNIKITTTTDIALRQAGIPKSCRDDVDHVLRSRIGFGYDTPPYAHNPENLVYGTVMRQNGGAEIAVLCEYYTQQERGKIRMEGPGTGYGRARYVGFKSRTKKFEIFLMSDKAVHQRVAYQNPLLIFASTGISPTQPMAQCDRSGKCTTTLLATPVNVVAGSKFGSRTHPITGEQKMHNGVDYPAASGTPIQAAGDGKVVKKLCQGGPCNRPCPGSGCSGGGNVIAICHANDLVTQYLHLREAAFVGVGQEVKQGQHVGNVGSTGGSTGPHLHYETFRQSCSSGQLAGARQYLNPLDVNGPPATSVAYADQEAFEYQQAAVDQTFGLMEGGAAGEECTSTAGSDDCKFLSNGASVYPAGKLQSGR